MRVRTLIIAVLASLLVVASAGAATHYLITSTHQIKPSVLAQLKGNRGYRGYTGATGSRGATGVAGAQGATGAQGPQGTPGTAAAQGAKGDPGAQGQQGPQGDPGAQGRQGDAGPAGPPGVSNWFRASNSANVYLNPSSSTPASVTVACPAGSMPLSGWGAWFVPQGTESHGDVSGGGSTWGWTEYYTIPAGTGQVSIEAIAICAAVNYTP
jgi:hypothetical protein